jgi:hypothetical protein
MSLPSRLNFRLHKSLLQPTKKEPHTKTIEAMLLSNRFNNYGPAFWSDNLRPPPLPRQRFWAFRTEAEGRSRNGHLI